MQINNKSYFLLVTTLILLLAININCCLNYDSSAKRCSQCPEGTRLYKGNCLYSLNFCQFYHQGIDCNKCQKGYKLVKIEDRVQCQKLLIKNNDQFIEQQIDINQKQSSFENQDRFQFYRFLDDYLTKKYLEQEPYKRLLKINDRIYKNGDHEVLVFYKTSEQVLKGVVAIISNYKSFELKSFGQAQKQDIPENQIIQYSFYEEEQNHPTQRSKNHPNQTQNDQTIKNSIIKEKQKQQQQNDQDQIKQSADFNYEYQKKQNRQKDIGFETSNQYLKLSNTKILGQNAKVIGCFVKTTGLRKNYRIFYKTSNQQIYQGQVIYDVVKRRSYILNFGKQFSK